MWGQKSSLSTDLQAGVGLTSLGKCAFCNSPKTQCVPSRALVVFAFTGTETEEVPVRGAGRTLNFILGILSLCS